MSTPAVTPQPDQTQYTPQEFAQKIRSQYPGSYDSIPDAELTDKILTKYPVYRGNVKTQFEVDRSGGPGFLKSLGSDLASTGKGILALPSMVSNPSEVIQRAAETGTNDLVRRGEGRSIPYRIAAGLSDMTGIANAPGMEESANKGDMAGVAGHATAAAAPLAIPLAVRGAAEAGPPIIRGVARGTNVALEKAPGMVGASAGAILGREVGHPEMGAAVGYGLGRELLPKLRVPGEQFGIKAQPIDALSEAAANSHPIDALSEIASQPHDPIAPAQTQEMQPAPYRMGRGAVQPEIVNPSAVNRDILANRGGVIVRQPKLLKAAPAFRKMTADTIDDAGVNQDAADWLDRQGQAANLEKSREYAENNSADIPKWKRLATFRAQMAAENVLREAELAQQIPARSTKTPPAKAGKASGNASILNPQGEDLTGILEQSLKQARAKKGPPKADK